MWETDPLVVLPLEAAHEALEDWSPVEEPELRVPFRVPLIPEALAKAGYSAGPGYAV